MAISQIIEFIYIEVVTISLMWGVTHLSGPDHVMLEILVTQSPPLTLCLLLTSQNWPMRGQDWAAVSQSEARKLSWWLTAAARGRESGDSQAATALRPTLEIYFRYDSSIPSDSQWKWQRVIYSRERDVFMIVKTVHYFRFWLRCSGGNKVWPSRPGRVEHFIAHQERERVENSGRRFPDSVKFIRPWHSDPILLYRAHPAAEACSAGYPVTTLQWSKNRPETMSFGSMFK